MDVQTPAEAVRALCHQLPEFENRLREGVYRIRRGTEENGIDESMPSLSVSLGRTKEIHIYPELSGAKRGGVGKVLLGIALIGASFLVPGMQGFALSKALGQTAFHVFGSAVTFGHVALFGVSMALGGVAQMLTPTPEVGNYGDREDNSSFLFNGPENRIQQGAVVPLAYGFDIWVGSVVVHSSIVVEDYAGNDPGGNYTDGPGTGGWDDTWRNFVGNPDTQLV